MVKNYLLVAIRNLLQNKGYSLINIARLTVGLASAVLGTLLVQHELSYDAFHKKGKRIVRVLRETQMPGTGRNISQGTSGALGPALAKDFQQIEKTVRMRWFRGKISVGSKSSTKLVCMADADVLEVFTFPLINGDSKTALQAPFTVVITKRVAHSFYGDLDPVGKVITYNNAEYTITGVAKDIPKQSTLYFDFLTGTLDHELRRKNLVFWHDEASFLPIQTFALMAEGAKLLKIGAQLPSFMAKYLNKTVCDRTNYLLQPLTRMHLYSRQDYGIQSRGNITTVYSAAVISTLILLIACINFSNLSTARSLKRTREIGLRKVVGANRSQVLGQFLGESMLTTLFTIPIVILLVYSLLPMFSNMVGRWLVFSPLKSLPYLLIETLAAGLLAGLYPAIYLSSFRPITIIEGSFPLHSKRTRIQDVLVVFQVTISVVLVICSLVVFYQLDYMRTKDLGFNKDHLIVVRLPNDYRPRTTRYETLKQKFLSHPDILKGAASHTLPGQWGGEQWLFKPQDNKETRMYMLAVDEEFLDVFEIPLLQGRNFSKEIQTDASAAFILNQTAANQLGWDDPVGKQFDWPSVKRRGKIIGVVQDFHLRPLRENIGPVVLCMWPPKSNKLSLKILGGKTHEALEHLEAQWKAVIPNRRFSFFLLDESLGKIYQDEETLGIMVSRFCGLAVFLACLGMLGLASFSARQRAKEFGIRKILGASTLNIVILQSKRFAFLAIIANLIAWPIAHYAMSTWLQNFPYKNNLSFGVFFITGLITFLIALVTVSFQALKAAKANPIEAIRSGS